MIIEKRIKVAIFIHLKKGYGGAERRLIRIAKDLNDAIFQTNILLFAEDSRIIDEFVIKERIQETSYCKFQSVALLLKHVRKSKYNYIWMFNISKIILLIASYSLFSRTKILLTVANFYYSHLRFENFKIRLAFLYVLRISKKVDCLYPDQLLFKKTPSAKIHITPIPFTDKEKFLPGIKKNIIVFASRMIDIKNPLLFLEAIKLSKDAILDHNFKVIIAGTGILDKEVNRYILENELSGLVNYIGHKNTEDFLPISKIFVSLQCEENYPSQVLIEAISTGNYIIGSDVGNTKIIVKPSFGKLVPLNIEDIAEAIRYSLHHVNVNHEKIITESTLFAQQNFNKVLSVNYYKKIFLGEEK